MKSSKVKLNAAKVIKDMSRKELEEFEITLEKKNGVNPPDLTTLFEFMQKFYQEFKTFVVDQNNKWAKQEKFNAKQEKFNKFVLDMFKKHKWIEQ